MKQIYVLLISIALLAGLYWLFGGLSHHEDKEITAVYSEWRNLIIEKKWHDAYLRMSPEYRSYATEDNFRMAFNYLSDSRHQYNELGSVGSRGANAWITINSRNHNAVTFKLVKESGKWHLTADTSVTVD